MSIDNDTRESEGLPPEGERGRPARHLAAPLVALVVAGLTGGGLTWYFNRVVPEEVDIDAAVAAVADETVATGAGSGLASGDTAVVDEDGSAVPIEGEWSVDTTIGTFGFEDATSSFAGFRIEEELIAVGTTTAVGRTPDVSGTIAIEGATVTAATIEVDLTGIVTNDSRRDDNVQDALETSSFPTATFELTEPIELGSHPEEGDIVTAIAAGDLTIHGATNPVEIQLEAQVVDGILVVVGSVDVVFGDYGVAVPSAPVVLSADDHGTPEMQLWFTRA